MVGRAVVEYLVAQYDPNMRALASGLDNKRDVHAGHPWNRGRHGIFDRFSASLTNRTAVGGNSDAEHMAGRVPVTVSHGPANFYHSKEIKDGNKIKLTMPVNFHKVTTRNSTDTLEKGTRKNSTETSMKASDGKSVHNANTTYKSKGHGSDPTEKKEAAAKDQQSAKLNENKGDKQHGPYFLTEEKGVVNGTFKSGGDNGTRQIENKQQVYLKINKSIQDKKIPQVKINETGGWLREVQWEPRMDLHDYKYLINPSKTCFTEDGDRANITLLILVATAPQHSMRRMAIRRTWINGTNAHNLPARTLFMLGVSSDKTAQRMVENEARRFNDILQEDFVDSYHNLSIKTIMGFKWAARFCSHGQFLMKTDDDVVVNVYTLARDLSLVDEKSRSDYVVGRRTSEAPIRNVKNKWYTPKHLFPGSMYPPYPQGHGYILSMDLAVRLYRVSTEVPLFPWEDVFVGILLDKLGVTVQGKTSFHFTDCMYKSGPLIKSNVTILALQRGYITWDLFTEEIEQVWRVIETGRWPKFEEKDKCTKEKILNSAYLP
ncbi:UDP-GalNAc:beta-1,3-N-acetylgalactosaminyltransferase 1-like [Diadema antillarum]|uniref:UDP-GalNAc:beta-1, 3-N-acetylgalactosaminyltransferase 1-like n=1 Tax=Diadema antillarum TaxID=105358 RepID=UPI003A854BD3